MKKIFRYTFLTIALSLATIAGLQAQTPPHPGQQSGGGGVGGNRIGSSAPTGEGTIFFLLLSAAYAFRIAHEQRTRNKEEIA